MKKLTIAFAAMFIAATAFGQGTIQFNNRIVGTVDARIFLPDGITGVGAGYKAQLYAGPAGSVISSLRALTPTTDFRTSSAAAAGYVNPVDLVIPGSPGGQKVTVVMRVFNGSTYETSTIRGESNPITITLGGASVPPTPAAALVGLQSFNLISPPAAPTITVQPTSQQTVAVGTTVTLRVEANGAFPLTYQWKKNGVAIAGATSPTLVLNVTSTSFGNYTVTVTNSVGSVTSKIAEINVSTVAPSAFVTRQLPSGYAPNEPILVTLKAAPPLNISVYAIEELPPAKWTVSNVSADGKWDTTTGKVKFGPYFDTISRTLTYHVTPPSGEIGAKTFTGTGSTDGKSVTIGGDRTIDRFAAHPADNNPSDGRITINEVTAYGAAWRKGSTWPIAPNPIPIDYVTRAGTLWKNGETYTIDSKVSGPPLWWVNTAPTATVRGLGLRNLSLSSPQSTVTSAMSALFVPGETFSIRVEIKPSPGVSAYAVQEEIPAGWKVARVADGGEFDPVNQEVKWGPFFDDQPRQLSYELTSPIDAVDTLSLSGSASFDGSNVATLGQRQSRATSRLGQLKPSAKGGFQLDVTGRQHASYKIEVSTNLQDWKPVGTVPNQNGRIEFADPESNSATLRFYRAVAQ